MAKQSKIEWTDSTFNPWIGCTRVSPACDNCYAAVSTPARAMRIDWGLGKARHRTSAANWSQPRQWEARAHEFFAAHGRRRRVFCASLADVFDNEVPPQWRYDLFQLIRETPSLDWLLLTKRIGNVRPMVAADPVDHDLPDNVWLGVTVANQDEADRDIPKLLATPATVCFLSCEPLLGPISFEGLFANPQNPNDGTNVIELLDWIIVGGESGHGARPMDAQWALDIKEACDLFGVPFFFKQGSQVNWPDFKDFDSFPDALKAREWPR